MGHPEAAWGPVAPVESPPALSSIPPGAAPKPAITAADGYDFLRDCGLATSALVHAAATARAWGVSLPEALIALRYLSETAYAEVVGRALGIEVAEHVTLRPGPPLTTVNQHPVRRLAGSNSAALVATSGPLADLQRGVDEVRRAGLRPVVVAPRTFLQARERIDRRRALAHATSALRKTRPDLSASRPPAIWLICALALAIGLFVGAFLVAPGIAVVAILLLLVAPFLGVVVVRCLALAALLRPRQIGMSYAPILDEDLPLYTVLVPLFDEAAVVPGLVASLARLDYPSAKVDIVLVLEEVDVATKVALLGDALPPNLSVIVVPDGKPRTKPRALNYAIQFARGTYVVVYDAEDRPEPDQLRKAVSAFRAGPSNLACVQAKLNLYNPRDSWFARQFTIEYSALFDAILPALAWLRLPVPLGGTSNHFPRALLDEIGGWDPFNVTEDADLGIRLARLGYVTDMLDSTTWEEAPVTWSQWKPQRTRWLKGWYQTWIVHMRHPLRLWRELGTRQTLGFHLFLGGIILSTLVHPWFYVLLAWVWLTADTSFEIPRAFEGWVLWLVSGSTLLLGYGSAIAIGVLASLRRRNGLVWWALQMPLCWLLVSFAAYRALWQLVWDPFLWEKTAHGRTKAR